MNKIPAIISGKPTFEKPFPINKPIVDTYWQKEPLTTAFDEIFSSNMLTGEQKYQLEFEKKICEITNAKHAVALANCTSGLMLAIQAITSQSTSGVAEKEAILPAFSFAATAHAAAWNRCSLKFVDIDDTLCLDPECVKNAITDKTALILGVHMYGCPCHPEKLDEISKETGIPIIFDAAHAIGASINGKPLGEFAQAHIFSFSPTKLITTIEGGMLITNDDELAQKIRLDRNYSNPPNYWTERCGLSARLGEPGAALGLVQLADIDSFISNRNAFVTQYKSLLEKVPGITFQNIPDGYQSSHKDFSIFINADDFGMNRDQLVKTLEAENIMTKNYFYPPLNIIKPYAEHKDLHLPITKEKSESVVSLPIYNYMNNNDIQTIAGAIISAHQYAKEILDALN